eukprot:TRINITY_DN17440_c0_g2_i1.p3 TRINITY_DN17440_c0_g2~~TRINITY_DN17440_c0_g2_i1.p3  ORF type:complete len:128 (-),score=19.29 TRINITY_DN17440_c0_g2_i1:682-1065(-)
MSIASGNLTQELAEAKEETVRMDIEHEEPAAQRDPELLAEQSRHDYADGVSQLLHGQASSDNPGFDMETEVTEPILLLAYSRYPENFRVALAQGSALDPCRSALVGRMNLVPKSLCILGNLMTRWRP